MQTIHVLTNRYDNSRSGVNLAETQLTVDNVNTSSFGKLFGRTVDGDLYAQPLIISGMNIAGKTCNVVYLATSRNWVYAYDADDPDACLPFWSRNLGAPVPRDDLFKNLNQTRKDGDKLGHYLNFGGEIGITSTPVISLSDCGGIIYVVAKTKVVQDVGGGASKLYAYKIHALNIATGEDAAIPNTPMEITATAQKTDGSIITFDPLLQLNRPGLLLVDGVLYLAFGSQGDVGDYFGWIMAFDAATLAQRAVYCTAPDWGEGGIWQSGGGLSSDEKSFVYAVVGNGEKPSNHTSNEIPDVISVGGITSPVYGNCILKLRLTEAGSVGETLEVIDWYTAPNVMDLNESDNDLIGCPVVFEAPGSDGTPKKLVLGGGKDGRIYVLDREKMGHWSPMTGGTPSCWRLDDNGKGQWKSWQGGKRPENAVQDDQLCYYHVHGTPIIWKKSDEDITAYVWSEKDFLKAYRFLQGRFQKTPKSTSQYGFPTDELRMPGGYLALSANAAAQDEDGTAIVWASHPTDDDAMNKTVKGTLRAYDARDLNVELWNSDQDVSGNDHVGNYAKFNHPVVANGKVYLATFSRELVVYGLLSERRNEAGIFDLRGVGEGVQGHCAFSCSRYEITASGKGLVGNTDSFFFANRVIDLNEQHKVSITARLEGIKTLNDPGNFAARAGIMIRKFEGANLPYAALVVTAGNDVLFQTRRSYDENSTQDGPFVQPPPQWLRLSCEPATTLTSYSFRAELSNDGHVWTPISSETVIQMDGRVMVGLVATSQVTPPPGQKPAIIKAGFTDVLITPYG